MASEGEVPPIGGTAKDGGNKEENDMNFDLAECFSSMLMSLYKDLDELYNQRDPTDSTRVIKMRCKKLHDKRKDLADKLLKMPDKIPDLLTRQWNIDAEPFYDDLASVPKWDDLEAIDKRLEDEMISSEEAMEKKSELQESLEKRDELITKFCANNMFLKGFDMDQKYAKKNFRKSRDAFVKQIKMLNVLSCLKVSLFSSVQGFMMDIGKKFNERLRSGKEMCWDDISGFLEEIQSRVSSEDMIEIERSIRRIMSMLGGIPDFRSMVDKMFGENELIRGILHALLDGGKEEVINKLSEAVGSMGAGKEDIEVNSDDEDDEDAGTEDEGGVEEDADAPDGVRQSRVGATAEEMYQVFEKLKPHLGEDGKNLYETGKKQFDEVMAKVAEGTASMGQSSELGKTKLDEAGED